MVINFLAFLLSFCSMAYELILSKAFYLVGFNETVSYTLTISVYLLGLGLGSLTIKAVSSPLKSLVRIELLLVLVGMISVLILWALGAYFDIMLHFWLRSFIPSNTFIFIKLCALQSVVLFLGYLSGKELNYLIFYSNKNNNNEGLVLGLTYFGGLVASFFVTFFLLKKMNEVQAIFLISNINLFVAFALLTYSRVKIDFFLAFATLFISLFLSGWLPHVSNFLIKAQYSSLKVLRFPNYVDHYNIYRQVLDARNVERFRSKYQILDFVFKSKNNFALYINKRPQFGSKIIDGYHQSMVRGLINLNKSVPKSVLVLGGGDGLLIKELLRVERVQEITLVELDPKIIELSNNYPPLLNLNEGSLKSERVNVVLQDAFLFLKTTNKSWDGILIDFPLPYSFDLSRLYSSEFYSLVKKRLSEGGGAVFDAPLLINVDEITGVQESESINILASTLKDANILEPTIYGAYEGFIYFNKVDKKRNFNYKKMGKNLSGAALVNLVPLDVFYPHEVRTNSSVNSIFSPIRFRDDR